ncbi:MAG: hypothetical protein KAW49_04550 [Anaerolineae bacterium]|jgi:hypothetical protein|nr:hypothetical protein [Chloroflexota bacterium]MCK4471037.1 hypothetical protein [Anaerolineae bacterium]
MPAYRRASIRELTSAAYELDSGIVEGRLHRDAGDGRWMVDDAKLNEWLARYDGQEIVLIVASLEDDRPMRSKVCRTCGREYVGIECPRCREARIRLRGY